MQRTLIIAEAGVNHNGDLNIAKQLVTAAADAGADVVKFQTFRAEYLVAKNARKARYQAERTGPRETQFEMLKRLELSEEDHSQLISFCRANKIRFLSTAFDLESLALLGKLRINILKVPSGEVTNYPYLKAVGAMRKKVIISTGMCTMQEIKDALVVLTEAGTGRSHITVLHCNTEYPTPLKHVNLLAMKSIARELDVRVGYSDHTLGIEVPIAAVALGATVLEKHFTLDRSMEGPDHAASVQPEELSNMVKAIRSIEQALGSDEKRPSSSEKKNKAAARKSIHLAVSVEEGHIIQANDLIMKRPGDGISPMQLNSIIGKKTTRSLKAEHKLKLSDVQ